MILGSARLGSLWAQLGARIRSLIEDERVCTTLVLRDDCTVTLVDPLTAFTLVERDSLILTIRRKSPDGC